MNYLQLQQSFSPQELIEDGKVRLWHQTRPEEVLLLTLWPAQPSAYIHPGTPDLSVEAFCLGPHHFHQPHPRYPVLVHINP